MGIEDADLNTQVTGDTGEQGGTDNSASEPSLDEQIAKALEEEPEQPTKAPTEAPSDAPTEAPTEAPKDNTQDECPEKFKNKDGSIDVQKLAKSYKELEPLINQKAELEKTNAELLKYKEQVEKEEKQRQEQAQKAGYNSAEDMQLEYEIASFTANKYAQYLNQCEDPAVVKNMLIDYMNNPTPEALEEIELEFSPNVIRTVSAQAERAKINYEQQVAMQQQTAKMTTIEGTISQLCEKYNDLLQDEETKQLLVDSIQKYGENFTFEDGDRLLTYISKIKDAQKAEKDAKLKEANSKQTDKLAGISGSNSAPPAQSEPDISKMSQAELEKYLAKFI